MDSVYSQPGPHLGRAVCKAGDICFTDITRTFSLTAACLKHLRVDLSALMKLQLTECCLACMHAARKPEVACSRQWRTLMCALAHGGAKCKHATFSSERHPQAAPVATLLHSQAHSPAGVPLSLHATARHRNAVPHTDRHNVQARAPARITRICKPPGWKLSRRAMTCTRTPGARHQDRVTQHSERSAPLPVLANLADALHHPLLLLTAQGLSKQAFPHIVPGRVSPAGLLRAPSALRGGGTWLLGASA